MDKDIVKVGAREIKAIRLLLGSLPHDKVNRIIVDLERSIFELNKEEKEENESEVCE
jgi:hypothetical protein